MTPRELDDLEVEFEFHLDMRAQELLREGMDPEAADAQARRELGDVDDTRRYVRTLDRRAAIQHRRRDYVGDFRRDVVYALRRLLAAPAFALTAVLTLGLGIGANTAIFTMVNAVVLRPLPYPAADDLYAVYSANREAGMTEASVSAVDLDDWRARRRLVADIGGFWHAEGSSGIDMTGRGDPRRLSAVFITPGFLDAMGVRAAAGRLPYEAELVRGGHDTVTLLTHAFWTREFGADPAVVGTTLTLGGRPYDVIGILPASLAYPTPDADVFVPFSTIPDSSIPRLRQVRVLGVVARATPGVDAASVREEMSAITRQLAAEYPEDRAWDAASVVPLVDVVVGPVRLGLLVLAGAVTLVLLMACVNVASLQLARAMGREREIAVRLALGARRGRLVRQLLTESLVLSVVGGAAGFGLAVWGLDALLALTAGQLPRVGEVSVDGRVIAFAAVVSLTSGLVFGVVPAFRAVRRRGGTVLQLGARGAAGPPHHRLRFALVVGEVAVSMMLVVGAGLLTRSFIALQHVDLGYKPERLLAVQFTIDTERHGRPYTDYYERVIAEVRSVPGIVAAAAVKDPPLRGNGELNGFVVPGRPVRAGEEPPLARAIHVSEGYFATIGARLAAGREFTDRDRAGTPLVLVVNEAFARAHFPDGRAVDETVLLGRGVPARIVGVVGDIRQVAVAEPPEPTIYLHNLQNTRVKTTIVARTAGDPLAMAAAVRRTIWSIDPSQAITAVFTFDEATSRSLARPRLLALLLAAFGGLGLALGAIGIYGLLASLVGERRREIGVRLALGARPSQVLGVVVRRGVGLTALGIAIGLLGAAGLARFMTAVLYDVSPMDPLTFGGMAGVLLFTAALASWLPARRASKVNPVEALRAD